MNAMAAGPRSRVIVAVGSTSPDPSTLAAAAQLAQLVDGELAALFVEDVNLLRLAELPIAFESSAALPTARPLQVADVERAFKKEAHEFKRALTEIASALQLDFTFDVVRGKPASVLFEAATERDLVVLAGAAARALTHHTPAKIVRHALRAAASGVKSRRAQPVAAVLQSGACVQRVLAVAHGLAIESGAELILVLAPGDAHNAPLTAMVERWLEEQGASARIVVLPNSVPENVAKLVAEAGSQLLIWPGDGNLEFASAVEPLLAAISCPLIVVR
jgi:hypothetical protein